MAIIVTSDESIQAPVSVYFGLKRGDTAELEVIAEAAIAWSTALKTMMAVVEPGVNFHVQLVDGDEGSLWLNTLLTFAESAMEQIARGAERYPRFLALARGLAIIVVATPLSVTSEDVWRAIIKQQPEAVSLSRQGQQQIKAILEKIISERIAESEREEFAKAVIMDQKINAIGVAPKPVPNPELIVSRDQIISYVNRERVISDTEEVRRRTVTMAVTLVSPVLEDAERSWRFRQPGMPEFGAVMRDRGFLSAVGRRSVHEEIRFGIPMEIEVEFREKYESGIWIPVERSVLRVITPPVDRAELPF